MLAHKHQIPTLLTRQRRYQGHESFRKIHKIKYHDTGNGNSRQNCPPRETFVAPEPDVKTRCRPKTGKNRVNAKFSRGRTFVTNITKDELHYSQNRDSLTEDLCSYHAFSKTLPRSLTILEDKRRCHSYFLRMISRTSSESDSSCNRVSNATRSVNGLRSSSSLNKGAPLAFRRLPDSNAGSNAHLHRFLTKNDSITARAGYPGFVRLSANIVKVLTQ